MDHFQTALAFDPRALTLLLAEKGRVKSQMCVIKGRYYYARIVRIYSTSAVAVERALARNTVRSEAEMSFEHVSMEVASA
jgi:hypothetical protein